MWFAASLLFKSVHPGQVDDHLWEESIFLVRAESEEEARQKADRLGKAEEHEYVAANGEMTQWTFQGVERIQEILDDKLEDGTEIFSRFLRGPEVQSLLEPLRE